MMKVLITAGPTREAIDPARFISNYSSGKMGYALANACAHSEFEVLLISGPTQLEVPINCDYIPVESAQEMYEAVEKHIHDVDVAIFSAAVADYTYASPAAQKIKKYGDTLIIELEKTKDILGSARVEFDFKGILIGFAAETENLLDNARIKLEKKGCDLIVANDILRKDSGFNVDHNQAYLVTSTGHQELPLLSKKALALAIIQWVQAH